MRIRKIVASAVATAGLLGAGLFTGASTASASVLPPESNGGIVHLVRGDSGRCLEIADWRTDNGAPARLWDCTGGANQAWYWTTDSAGRDVYRNVNSGKCLEIADWSTNYWAAARQWDCTGGANQAWWFGTEGNATYGYVGNYNSGQCLLTEGLGNGTVATQYNCNSGLVSKWYRRG